MHTYTTWQKKRGEVSSPHLCHRNNIAKWYTPIPPPVLLFVFEKKYWNSVSCHLLQAPLYVLGCLFSLFVGFFFFLFSFCCESQSRKEKRERIAYRFVTCRDTHHMPDQVRPQPHHTLVVVVRRTIGGHPESPLQHALLVALPTQPPPCVTVGVPCFFLFPYRLRSLAVCTEPSYRAVCVMCFVLFFCVQGGVSLLPVVVKPLPTPWGILWWCGGDNRFRVGSNA